MSSVDNGKAALEQIGFMEHSIAELRAQVEKLVAEADAQPTLITAAEAMAMTSIKESKFYQLCREGRMPGARRVDGKVLINKRDLAEATAGGDALFGTPIPRRAF